MKNDNTPKPILSISMLISGRDEMVKSLKSLHYFKDAFPCEIILVDTGCNEEQRALAERYADKIVDFTWCNDFAAARNAGLTEAKGEWFLYLDDDEWFEEPKEMIAFFTSEEYRKYGCADYAVRNYSVPDGSLYDDAWVSRMTRLDSGVRFVGKIHEHMTFMPAPKKIFSDFVHHYGYVFQDEAERNRHAERNIKPLRELVKEEPEKARWAMQLAQEYVFLREYEKAVDMCREWLGEYERLENKDLNNAKDLGCVHCYLIYSLYNLKRNEEALEYMEKALKEKELQMEHLGPTIAFLHWHGVMLNKEIGNEEECCKHFRIYLKYKKKLGDDLDALQMGGSLFVTEVFQKGRLYPAVLTCVPFLIRMKEEKTAKKAFYMLDWSDVGLLRGEEWEGRVLDACCNAAYSKAWVSILQALVSREGGMQEMHNVFLTTGGKYKQEGETEKLEKLRRLVSELEYDHYYILYTKIIVKSGKLKEAVADGEETRETKKARKEIEFLFAELFKNYPDNLMEIPSEAWDAAVKWDIPMEVLLLGVDYRTWKDGLEVWNKISAVETIRRWEDRAVAWKKTPDIRYDVFHIKCAEGILLRYQEKSEEGKKSLEDSIGLTQWEEAFWKYADSVLALYGPLYKEAVLEEVPEILPDEMWIALYLKKLKACRENRDDKGALSALRKCLGISRLLEKSLEAYAELLKNEIQSRDWEARKARKELEGLVKTLKATAKQQMEQGKYKAAKEILRQVQACVPEDGEVKELLRQIGKRARETGGISDEDV